MGNTNRVFSVLAMLLFFIGATLILYSIEEQRQTAVRDDSLYEEIASQVKSPSASSPAADNDSPVQAFPTIEPQTATDVPTVSPATPETFSALLPAESGGSAVDLSVLQAQSKDFVAWLNIPGTVIDYPVVRSDDSDYYLHHLFTGQKSKLGCLFSLTTSDYQLPSRNVAIYGHHLSSSDAMFSSLISYKEESYYSEHSTIRLSSLYGTRTYRIFAVLNQKVTDWDASTAAFKDNRAFLSFVQRAKGLSLYETGVEVAADDHILTLITCDRSYGGIRGRLVVMAVEEPKKEEKTNP